MNCHAIETRTMKAMDEISHDQLESLLSETMSLKESLDLTPDDLETLTYLGYELFNQGKIEESQCIFEGLDSLGTEDPYVKTALGTIYAQKDDLDNAERYFNAALAMDPNDINALTNRGEVFLKQNRLELAAEDLKRAIELDPHELSPIAARARLLVMATKELLDSMTVKA